VSFKVSIEPQAAQEIEAAFTWYETRNAGLGSTFLKAVAAATERLERSADQFKLERNKYRRIHLTKFPYAMHYTISGPQVLVLACLHARQNPALWPGV
jgi:plasmid stabilization system protein ParE